MYKSNIHKCTFNIVDKYPENSLKVAIMFQKFMFLGVKLIFTNMFIIKLKPFYRCNDPHMPHMSMFLQYNHITHFKDQIKFVK
jgi:hypothetical protein